MKLKKNIKVMLYLLLIALSIIIIKDLFTKKTTIITNGKNYTCHGNFILQVCSGENYDI